MKLFIINEDKLPGTHWHDLLGHRNLRTLHLLNRTYCNKTDKIFGISTPKLAIVTGCLSQETVFDQRYFQFCQICISERFSCDFLLTKPDMQRQNGYHLLN